MYVRTTLHDLSKNIINRYTFVDGSIYGRVLCLAPKGLQNYELKLVFVLFSTMYK